MFAKDITGVRFVGPIDVDYFCRESQQWVPMTTARNREAAQSAIEIAIREARKSGNFAISLSDFRCLKAK